MKSNKKVDMLSGPLAPRLLEFAVPLIFSGMLQQSFVVADTAVIGRFSTSHALAAVGSNGPLVNILVNMFIGLSIGANVVIASYIGSNNKSGVKKAVSTTAAVALISGFALLIFGQILSGPILEMLGTPADVIGLAEQYLDIYFLGMPFMMAYNFGSAVLRSMGDTRRPLYALIVSAAVNVVLNLLLTGVLDMGIAGVAVATVVANAINAAFIVWWLIHEEETYRLNISGIGISQTEFRQMLRIGIPAGMQGMIFSGANLVIQSAINSFGADAMAGSSVALTYEAYCYFIIAAFAQSVTAFISQNYGAGNFDRCRHIVKECMILAAVLIIISTWCIGINAEHFIRAFSSDAAVIPWGIKRIHCVLMLQTIACSYELCGAAMRGMGNSLTPMLLTVFGTCFLRLIWIFVVIANHHDFELLFSIYPISWTVTGLLVVMAYRRMSANLLQSDNPEVSLTTT